MGQIMQKFAFLLFSSLVLLFAGCSEGPQAATKKSPKPAEPVTGQTALYRMYQVARSWAPDAQVLKMNSIHLTEIPGVRGKAGAWQATFTSMARGEGRSYTYSVAEEEGNLHEGVFPGPQEHWSGPADASFLIAAVKVDTEIAYKTALKKAEDYDKTNPNQTISFILEKPEKGSIPEWRVIWGESASTSGISVLVDASTGLYLKTLH